MTLNEVMTQTADAIREKTGKSELIAPVDFAEEIKGITAGGGESGSSTIEYLDISGLSGYAKMDMCMYSLAVKGLLGEQQMAGFPTNAYFTAQGKSTDVTACIIDFSLEIKAMVEGSIMTMTVGEQIKNSGTDIDSIPRITKEQFYDLNA